MARPVTSKRELSLVLVLAGVFCAAAIGVVLMSFGGWEYYRTPLATRGYMPAHKFLRPSGIIGLPLGIAGAIAMLSTLPYAARKRWRPLARLGSTPKWLEVHIFFGIVGPVLVTLHTAFKFNGVVAVGYWLMMIVWSSGFVGRYLYVRIPKTIRGVETADVERIRRLFHYWHVFHRPLVYGMLVIVGLHVGLAIYLGYAQLLTLAVR